MIKVIVRGQELSLVTPEVVEESHNYITIEGDFKGQEWDKCYKFIHFIKDGLRYDFSFDGDKIGADAHIDLQDGIWDVFCNGNIYDEDQQTTTTRITTKMVRLKVERLDVGEPGGIFPEIPPEQAEVLSNRVTYAIELAKSVKDAADAGEYDGATFLPAVSEEGIISWTNDKEKENPESRSIKGPKGDTGDSAVYIGTSEPEDPKKTVWIDPSGDATFAIRSFEWTSGNHTPGTYDVYTITKTDDTTIELKVWNGVDGTGVGDMVKATYDPQSKREDVYAYADTAAETAASTKANASDLTAHIEDNSNPHGVTAAQVGLENVDNTADIDKPVSTAQQAALDLKADISSLATVATSGKYTDLTDTPAIDTVMSSTSENAVQNKVIKGYVDEAVANVTIDVDSALSSTSTNPVQNKVVRNNLASLLAGTAVSISVAQSSVSWRYHGDIKTTKTGYTLIGITEFSFSDVNLSVAEVGFADDYVWINGILRDGATISGDVTAQLGLLWMKNV